MLLLGFNFLTVHLFPSFSQELLFQHILLFQIYKSFHVIINVFNGIFRMYPPGGFTGLVQSDSSPDNFHLVGNTRSRTTPSPTAPSLKRPLPAKSNAQDKETINVDADETNEDERTERRLNWTKPEDVRLVSILS
jgi:hypothetical protein